MNITSQRKKVPLFLYTAGSLLWCTIGVALIAAFLLDAELWGVSVVGFLSLLIGIITCYNYYKNAPSIGIKNGLVSFSKQEVYNSNDIACIRYTTNGTDTLFRPLNIFIIIVALLLVVAIVASIMGEGGELLECFGDIGWPDANNRKKEAIVLHFKSGSSKYLLSTMYSNYTQLKEAIHTISQKTC